MIRRLATLIVRPRKGPESGAIAVQFAFLLLPLMILSFGLVDLNRASTEKKRLQDALDAATLTAARSLAVTDAELQVVGERTLGANLSEMTDATLQSSSFKTVSGTSTISGTAVAKVKPIIANLWLRGDMTVNAGSEVVRSMNKVEVAMVLDVTGSMKGTKLTELKKAAKDFVDKLSAAAARSVETDPVKIGIVPFSNTVRLSDDTTQLNTYKSAAWMDKGTAPISGDIFNGRANVNRFTLLSNMSRSWGGCIESRAMPYDIQDTAPTTATPATLITPYFWPDASDNDGTYGNDYLGDGSYTSQSGTYNDFRRRQGYTGKYTSKGSGDGPNKGCTMEPLTRLTTNWTDLKNSIDDFTAVGETHIPVGLVWGWHLLSPNLPFKDGVAYSTPKTSKIVVLMTDGDNTYEDDNKGANDSNYDAYGFIWNKRMSTTLDIGSSGGQRTTAIDSRLSTLCTNMKNAGIIIYTVRVEVKTGTSTLLSNCATKSDMFYDVQSASNLSAVFSAIAGSIENLRISK